MRGHTSGSRPIISQIIWTGTWAAISSTNSTSPFSHTSSTTTAARRSISSTSMRDHPRGEALGHEPPVAVVLGRVHVEDREPQAGQRLLVGGRDERAAQLGGEGVAVVADGPHVGVLGDAPRSRGRPARGARTPAPRPAAGRTGRGARRGPRCRPSRSMPSRRSSVTVIACDLLWSSGDDAAEGGDRQLVGHRVGVDPAHHLQAQQQADQRPAPCRARRPRRRPTRRRPRRRRPTPPR